MLHYCDYDTIEHYEPGAFCSKYKTELRGKIKEIELDTRLKSEVVWSFKDGRYATYLTLAPLELYRVFGTYAKNGAHSIPRGARSLGGFASTEFAESIIDAKMRLALDPSWLNTKMYEEKIILPAGNVIHVGTVASVTLKSGAVLPGGADQILLPHDWSEEWIVGYRRITSRQLQQLPKYTLEKPSQYIRKEELYRKICPLCGSEKVRTLNDEARFTITGKKGNRYTMKFFCQEPECQYYW